MKWDDLDVVIRDVETITFRTKCDVMWWFKADCDDVGLANFKVDFITIGGFHRKNVTFRTKCDDVGVVIS